MKLSLDVPQEDELATHVCLSSHPLVSVCCRAPRALRLTLTCAAFPPSQVLAGGVSPYAPIVFLTVEKHIRRFFTMEEASDDEKKRCVLGSASAARAAHPPAPPSWHADAHQRRRSPDAASLSCPGPCCQLGRCLFLLSAQGHHKRQRAPPCAQVALAHGQGGLDGGKRLGNQSQSASRPPFSLPPPPPPSQVKLLLTLFPKAQFIYMHRDPYRVFASAANMAQTTYWFNYMATPSSEQVAVPCLAPCPLSLVSARLWSPLSLTRQSSLDPRVYHRPV